MAHVLEPLPRERRVLQPLPPLDPPQQLEPHWERRGGSASTAPATINSAAASGSPGCHPVRGSADFTPGRVPSCSKWSQSASLYLCRLDGLLTGRAGRGNTSPMAAAAAAHASSFSLLCRAASFGATSSASSRARLDSRAASECTRNFLILSPNVYAIFIYWYTMRDKGTRKKAIRDQGNTPATRGG